MDGRGTARIALGESTVGVGSDKPEPDQFCEVLGVCPSAIGSLLR